MDLWDGLFTTRSYTYKLIDKRSWYAKPQVNTQRRSLLIMFTILNAFWIMLVQLMQKPFWCPLYQHIWSCFTISTILPYKIHDFAVRSMYLALSYMKHASKTFDFAK